jgi:hypothetical protein
VVHITLVLAALVDLERQPVFLFRRVQRTQLLLAAAARQLPMVQILCFLPLLLLAGAKAVLAHLIQQV